MQVKYEALKQDNNQIHEKLVNMEKQEEAINKQMDIIIQENQNIKDSMINLQ